MAALGVAAALLVVLVAAWAAFTSHRWPSRFTLAALAQRRERAIPPAPAVAAPESGPEPDAPPPDIEEGPAGLGRRAVARLAHQAWMRRGAWARDRDALLDDPSAAEALSLLRAAELSSSGLADLIDWARQKASSGADYVMITLALELLGEREPDPALRARLLALVWFAPGEPLRPYTLRVIRSLARLGAPLLDDLVVRIPQAWEKDDGLHAAIGELLLGLLDAGDDLHPAQLPPRDEDSGPPPAVPVIDAAAAAVGGARGVRLTRLATLVSLAGEALRYATILPTDGLVERAHIVETDARRVIAAGIVDAVIDRPPTSVVVHGDAGSGRTSLLRLALAQLGEQGFVVIDATPDQVAAGQMWVNQLDGRMERLATALDGRRVVWLIPGLESGLTSGRASGDPRSFADRLAPHVASGRMIVLAELSGEGFQALPRECAALARALRAVATPALDEQDLLRVGHAAVAREAERRALSVSASDAIVGQAIKLARALLPQLALPGSLARLLTAGVAARDDANDESELRREDLFAGLTALTGMPQRVLDDTQPLDLEALRARLAQRVLGQPESIDALVERIALIKAGLCDPQRPYGVFLFVGPTGTGKTELARALAAELFGSPERMVRMDMSELKGPEGAERIIGTGDTRGGESLASRIRAQPFSVVLLDEFEKAYAPLWDLFLQVFDAGRLTDSSGRSVDFRQTIVIVTSNLGSAIEARQALGFGERSEDAFSSERVERAVRGMLRPELVNRFDRVIVFRPLARNVMRGIVRNEVRQALRRRGLVDRDWAIEIDESAVEFLLDSGFTRDMGARPLRRAVERHLLAPLARVIATHEAPRGEQFLFVSSESDRLDVRFVAAGEPERPGDEEAPAASTQSARDVAREGRGRRSDLRVLRDTLSALRELAGEAHWRERKAAALAATSSPGFWERDDRFAVLGLAETMDRIEAQLGSCASLLDRLFALAPGEDVRIDPGPVARLARELVQLDRAMQSIEADRAQDALIEVEADAEGQPFAAELAAMYAAWARLRGARATVVDTSRTPGVTQLHVEGLGAYDALAHEQGLHVYESRRDGRAERHALVRVTVMPWAHPVAPARGSSITRTPADPELAVVRRYQREPTPLVRDLRGGWRTGRIERVLAGDFDLYGTE